ncbi:MAG: TolC family protein [Bacteroidia bacterium]
MKYLFLILFSFGLLFAQSSLSLEECQNMARTNSPAARIAKLTQKGQQFDYQAFKAGFSPQVSLDGNLPGLSRSISNILQDDGSIRFVPQSQTFSTVALNINQAIPQTGGSVFVYSSLFNRLDLTDPSNQLWQSSPFVLGINQPLFGINRFKWEQRNQDTRISLSRLDYTSAVESASRRATELYFDVLLAQTQREIARANVANNDTIFTISKGRFSVGKIAENDLLQSELSLMNARTAFETAEVNYQLAIQRLRIVLGMDASEPLLLENPGPTPQIGLAPADAVTKALGAGRLQLAAKLMRLEAEQALAVAKTQNRISADLNATFGLNQTATSLSDAYRNPVDRETFSIGFSVPLLNWGAGQDRVDAAKARLEAAEITVEQNMAEFKADVAYQISNIQLLQQQLRRSARGDTIAARRFEVTKQRYLVGKIELQALFIAQQEKDQARRSYLNTLRNYWLALSGLREQTLYDFVEDRPISH